MADLKDGAIPGISTVLMPSPFVHSLLPTACLMASSERVSGKLKLRGKVRLALVGVLLSNLPDLDIIPGLVFSAHFTEIHRAWGHNLFISLVWIYLGAWILGKYVAPEFKGHRGLRVSFLLVASHLFLDASAQHNMAGSNPAVPLFFPFTRTNYTVPMPIFETMNFGLPPRFFSLPLDLLGTLSFWREILICEMLPSLFLFSAYWLLAEGYQFCASRMASMRANKYG